MQTMLFTLVAALIAFIIDFALGFIGTKLTGVPSDFPPFTLLPILSGTVGGAVAAALVYSVLRFVSPVPDRLFFFVSLAVFALSLSLPLRLSFTHSARFAGVTPGAQMMLVLMHAVVAVVSVIALTARPGV
jgi:hypothetical protein